MDPPNWPMCTPNALHTSPTPTAGFLYMHASDSGESEALQTVGEHVQKACLTTKLRESTWTWAFSTVQEKINRKLTTYSLALQDQEKAYNLKVSPNRRGNKKCGAQEYIEKIKESLRIPNKAVRRYFSLKPVSKAYRRWLLQINARTATQDFKEHKKWHHQKNTIIFQ